MQTLNLGNILDKKFIGADNLRKNLTVILKELAKDGEVVITQNGQPKAVLMDIKKYKKIMQHIQSRTTQTYD